MLPWVRRPENKAKIINRLWVAGKAWAKLKSVGIACYYPAGSESFVK